MYRPRLKDHTDEGHPDEVRLLLDAIDTEATMAMSTGEKRRAEGLLAIKRRFLDGTGDHYTNGQDDTQDH